YLNTSKVKKRAKNRIIIDHIARVTFALATFFALFMLAILLYRIFSEGLSSININFLTGKLSTNAERAGILGAILGTFWLMLVVVPVTLLFGVGTAVYLELYGKKGSLKSFIQLNIANLAGVPSIV